MEYDAKAIFLDFIRGFSLHNLIYCTRSNWRRSPCIFNFSHFTLNIQMNETIVKWLIGDADNA